MQTGNFIYVYKGDAPGEKAVIMAGVHGDEVGGIYAFYWLRDVFLPQNPIKKGSLTLILANLKAAELNRRFADTDMNRVFDREAGDEYEVRRVGEIRKALQGCRYMLDLHSTSRPSVPMTCSESTPEHMRICKVMPVKYMVTNWEGRIVGTSSDSLVDGIGGAGVTLECGQHLSPEAKEVAKRGATNFLKVLGMINGEIETEEKPVEICLFETFYPESEHFEFLVKPESFTEIKKGEIYAKDGHKNYIADEDCLLVMPNKIIKKGIEAGYLGRVVQQ